jgi:hypothetical protein
LMRSFFKLLKKDSFTALSQRLPFRLILGSLSPHPIWRVQPDVVHQPITKYTHGEPISRYTSR